MQPDRRRLLRLSSAVVLAANGLPVQALAHDDTVVRRLRMTATFTNPRSEPLSDQKFWCYLPASAPAFQQLVDVKASMSFKVLDDVWGHRVLALSFDHFAAYAQKVVAVTVETALSVEPTQQTLHDPSAWLSSERFIESDNGLIRAAAARLRRETLAETGQAIYEWVSTNIAYAGYVADDLGALYALQNRQGDCTEYADLVVALSRANGIPARMVGGYVVNRDSGLDPRDYHNWAEVHLAGMWQVVDAQRRLWLAPRSQYIVFRIYRDAVSSPLENAHRHRTLGALQTVF